MSEYNLPNYGTDIAEFISNELKSSLQKVIGRQLDKQALSIMEYKCKEIISNFPFEITDGEITIKQNETDPTRIDLAFPIIPELLGYVLFNPNNDNHYWEFVSDTMIYANSKPFQSYKCKKCGLAMIINNGWKLTRQNLTCEEMMIKDIIE
jgi:hypothetical protein